MPLSNLGTSNNQVSNPTNYRTFSKTEATQIHRFTWAKGNTTQLAHLVRSTHLSLVAESGRLLTWLIIRGLQIHFRRTKHWIRLACQMHMGITINLFKNKQQVDLPKNNQISFLEIKKTIKCLHSHPNVTQRKIGSVTIE